MIIKLLNVELERETKIQVLLMSIIMIKCVTEILTQLLATFT